MECDVSCLPRPGPPQSRPDKDWQPAVSVGGDPERHTGGRETARQGGRAYNTGCVNEGGPLGATGARAPWGRPEAVQKGPLSGKEAGTPVHSVPSLADGGLLWGHQLPGTSDLPCVGAEFTPVATGSTQAE